MEFATQLWGFLFYHCTRPYIYSRAWESRLTLLLLQSVVTGITTYGNTTMLLLGVY